MIHGEDVAIMHFDNLARLGLSLHNFANANSGFSGEVREDRGAKLREESAQVGAEMCRSRVVGWDGEPAEMSKGPANRPAGAGRVGRENFTGEEN